MACGHALAQPVLSVTSGHLGAGEPPGPAQWPWLREAASVPIGAIRSPSSAGPENGGLAGSSLPPPCKSVLIVSPLINETALRLSSHLAGIQTIPALCFQPLHWFELSQMGKVGSCLRLPCQPPPGRPFPKENFSVELYTFTATSAVTGIRSFPQHLSQQGSIPKATIQPGATRVPRL